MKKCISFCAAFLLSFASSPVFASNGTAPGANSLPVLLVLILATSLLKLWISFPFFPKDARVRRYLCISIPILQAAVNIAVYILPRCYLDPLNVFMYSVLFYFLLVPWEGFRHYFCCEHCIPNSPALRQTFLCAFSSNLVIFAAFLLLGRFLFP